MEREGGETSVWYGVGGIYMVTFTLDNTSVLSFLIQQPCKVEQGLFAISHFRYKLLGLRETK